MKSLLIILSFLLGNCTSTTTMKDLNDDKCKTNIVVIKSKDSIQKIESLLDNDDFYIEGNSQFYLFELVVNPDLVIEDVVVKLKSNEKYIPELTNILKELNLAKIKKRSKCGQFSFPFIINARTKKIDYPKDKLFYKVDLPLE